MESLDLSNMKIAILGIGREGMAARHFLRALYPEIDLALICESEPDSSVIDRLEERDKLLVCPLSEAPLNHFDLLIRSPGISPYRSCMQEAKSSGTRISSASNLWFAAHPAAKTICITGTKGKSTTSALVAHALRACGFTVRLAGNIGQPLLSCDDRDVDWWVIELSSYQLADLEAQPTVSVLLNLTAEHLDWHGTEQVYRRDKLRLAHLAAGATLIANAADPVLMESLSAFENVCWFNSASKIHLQDSQLRDGADELALSLPPGLPGAHSLANVAAALTVVRAIGADLEKAAHSFSTFRSLPHRLQQVGERAGVRYINDSISSTPVATAAALTALSGQKITLIVGGLDRGLDWTPYMEVFKANTPVAVIALPDNGPRIIDTMRAANLTPVKGLHLSAGLADAVILAGQLMQGGGLVLLSPGAPSFPQFRDYRDRGRQFAQLSGFEPEEWDVC